MPLGEPTTDQLDDDLAAVAPEFVAQMNANFEDSILLVGRILGEHRQATAARATAIDRAALAVTVVDGGHEHTLRIEFAEPLTGADQLTAAALALVVRARELSGEAGTTSAEELLAGTGTIRTFVTTVTAIEDLHPHLRRITFGGGDLTTFAPLGPDTFMYVLLPPPGHDALTIDQSFTWAHYQQMPEALRPVGAYYTVRHRRPEGAELDMLFVLHGDTGPASAWAARAQVGQSVALWGPRTAYEPPAGTEWFLLVADETGLPAAATIVEHLPPGTRAHVFAEVDCEAEQQPIASRPDVSVHWLYRNGAPAGTTTLLVDAVRALPWPGGTPYAWGGGESRTMTAVRRYLRGEVGLSREAVSMVAYWRHPTSPPDDD